MTSAEVSGSKNSEMGGGLGWLAGHGVFQVFRLTGLRRLHRQK